MNDSEYSVKKENIDLQKIATDYFVKSRQQETKIEELERHIEVMKVQQNINVVQDPSVSAAASDSQIIKDVF